MTINVFETIQNSRRLTAQTERAQQEVMQGEFAYVDTLYETNPQAGMDYAKKIGLLPQGSTLTSVSINGVDTPAASIPGLAKPIVLPSAGRTTQRASGAAQTLETQKATAMAEREGQREKAKADRLTYTYSKKKEIELLKKQVEHANRMDENLQKSAFELEQLAAKAELDWVSDEAKADFDRKKLELEYQLKGALEGVKQEGTMEKTALQTTTQKEVAEIGADSRQNVAITNQNGATLRNKENNQVKVDINTTNNAAKSMAQVRAGEQELEQIAAQGRETRKNNSEKPVSQGSRRLSVAPVTPDQEMNTWRALGPAMKESGYGGNWMDAPDHVKSGVNAIAEAANVIAGAYKKAGVVKSNTQITRQIAAELKNPKSSLWIIDGDSGEKTINIDALAEMAQGEIDLVTYGKDVANFRAKDPKYSKNLTDAEIASLIKKHKGE